MTEFLALFINLFVLLFWVAAWLTGAGIVLALVVFPIAWLYSLFVSPPD